VEMELSASVSDKTDSSLADQTAYVWNSYEELLAKSRSNDIPKSAIERSQLHAHIDILRREPYEVESAKILELAKSLFSPIRRLPPEIMSLIFQFEADELILICRTTTTRNPSNFSGFIFLLTWVCTWWREIILSQPSFWTSMKISSSSLSANDQFETTNSLLRECLLRAGSTMPLRFHIFLGLGVRLSAPGLSGVLDALAEVASRWKEFRVGVPSKLVYYMLDQIHPGTFPVLELLHFGVYAPPSGTAIMPKHFESPFIHCPRLHTFSTRNASLTHDTIDLKHLVTLKLSVYVCSFFAVLLEKCPLLQTFSVGYCLEPENSEAPISPSRPIHHTQLKSLNFGLFHIPNEIDPWESVYLPKLTCLEIEAEDVVGADMVNRLHELKALATRSKCVLDRILLEGDIPDDVLASFFWGIPVSSETASRIVNETPYTPAPPSSS